MKKKDASEEAIAFDAGKIENPRMETAEMDHEPAKRKKEELLKKTSRNRLPSNRRLNSTSRIQRMKQPRKNRVQKTIAFALLFFILAVTARGFYTLIKPRNMRSGYSREYDFSLSLNDFRHLSASKFDFAMAALLVAKEDFRETFRQELEVPKYLNMIDRMVCKIQPRIEDRMAPEDVISTISDYLYKKENFRTSQNGWDPSNLYLNLILEGKQGYCLGFVELWLSLAERLQWRGKRLPIYGVLVPFHIFCRWDDGRYKQNIETLHVPPPDWKPSAYVLLSELFSLKVELPLEAGRNMPDSFYKENYGITEQSIAQKIYLSNLSPQEVISCIYSNKSALHLESLRYMRDLKNRQEALEKCNRDILESLRWHEYNPMANRSRANVLSFHQARNKEALECLEKIVHIDPCADTLCLMGQICIYEGKFKEAWQYLEKAENARAFAKSVKQLIPYYKATIYYLQKDYTRTIQFCKEFLTEYNPEKTDVLFKLLLLNLYLYNDLGEHDKAMAIAYLLKGMDHGQQRQEEILVAFGEIHRHLGEWKEAKENFEKVLWHKPDSLYALKGVALCHMNEKDYGKSRHYLQQALIYDPNFREAKALMEKLDFLEKEEKDTSSGKR